MKFLHNLLFPIWIWPALGKIFRISWDIRMHSTREFSKKKRLLIVMLLRFCYCRPMCKIISVKLRLHCYPNGKARFIRHSTKQGLDLWTRGPVDPWTDFFLNFTKMQGGSIAALSLIFLLIRTMYFHCKTSCIQRVQPAFLPFLVVIATELRP